MELKYNSQYTSEQFNNTINTVNNCWIQLEVTGGLEGDIINLSPGNKYILTNIIPNNPSWIASNTDYYRYVENKLVQYPNYDLYILNNENISTKTNSKITYTTNLDVNHIYYFQAFVDGLNSNGVEHGIRIGSSSNPSLSAYLSSYTTSSDAITLSCRGTILQSSVDISLYASRNVSSVSEVHFGRLTLVDLTTCFGSGNEPTKEWCDNNINFYSPTGDYNSSINIISSKTKFTPVSLSLDNNGRCLINLPGFDMWTPRLNSNYYFWDKYTIGTKYRIIAIDKDRTTMNYAISHYYFGKTFSFDTSTGVFTVNQDTRGDSSLISDNLYFINFSSSSNTFTGQELRQVYSYYSSGSSSYNCVYYKYIPEAYPDPGNYIEHVYSIDPNAYPDNGIKDGYWYIKNNGLKTTLYESLYINEVKRYFLDVSIN